MKYSLPKSSFSPLSTHFRGLLIQALELCILITFVNTICIILSFNILSVFMQIVVIFCVIMLSAIMLSVIILIVFVQIAVIFVS
jgi:hypothetical protein